MDPRPIGGGREERPEINLERSGHHGPVLQATRLRHRFGQYKVTSPW